MDYYHTRNPVCGFSDKCNDTICNHLVKLFLQCAVNGYQYPSWGVYNWLYIGIDSDSVRGFQFSKTSKHILKLLEHLLLCKYSRGFHGGTNTFRLIAVEDLQKTHSNTEFQAQNRGVVTLQHIELNSVSFRFEWRISCIYQQLLLLCHCTLLQMLWWAEGVHNLGHL